MMKISVFKPPALKGVFSKASESVENIHGHDSTSNSQVLERLQQEYKNNSCVNSISPCGCEEYPKKDNLINGHRLHMHFYKKSLQWDYTGWGLVCCKCNLRVCASKMTSLNFSEQLSRYTQQSTSTTNLSVIQARKNKKGMQDAITRIPVPPGLITISKVLYEIGDRSLSRQKLVEVMRWGDDGNFSLMLNTIKARVN